MPNEISPVKIKKTARLFTLGNLCLMPLYLVDSRIGLLISIAANVAALYYFHELGQQRRPGSNALNRFNTTFFASRKETESRELDNAVRNVVNGGDAVFDEIVSVLSPR